MNSVNITVYGKLNCNFFLQKNLLSVDLKLPQAQELRISLFTSPCLQVVIISLGWFLMLAFIELKITVQLGNSVKKRKCGVFYLKKQKPYEYSDEKLKSNTKTW